MIVVQISTQKAGWGLLIAENEEQAKELLWKWLKESQGQSSVVALWNSKDEPIQPFKYMPSGQWKPL